MSAATCGSPALTRSPGVGSASGEREQAFGWALERLRDDGFAVLPPLAANAKRLWESARAYRAPPPAARRAGQTVVLGLLGAGHLGDVVCCSTLPRKLVQEYGWRVQMVCHRGVAQVFMGNPYVSGLLKRAGMRCGARLKRQGHVIQRLEASFGLEPDLEPRGEIYLSADELAWGAMVRRSLAEGRPLAIVAVGSLSDSRFGHKPFGAWERWGELLAQRYRVVQLALTDRRALLGTVPVRGERLRSWQPDPLMRNCAVLENLSPREFFSLFAEADLFLGCNSGGAHVAAAFRVPSIVVLPTRQYGGKRLFSRLPPGHDSRSFLYPQHAFLRV